MRLSALAAATLALGLLSGAHAARIFDHFVVPGTLPGQMNAQQQAAVGLMVITARNALAGSDSRSSDPWPCVPEDTVAAFVSPNTLGAYARIKASLTQQGWQLQKEVRQPGFDQYSVLYSKGGLNMMGMWAAGLQGTRSTLFLCQQARNWKPQPGAQVNLPQTAPRLALPFVVNLAGWNAGVRGVRAAGLDQDDELRLVARGTVTASGRLTLALPAQPNPALLHPAGDWQTAFGLGEDTCTSGSLSGQVAVSAPKVSLLLQDDLDLLQGALSPSATAEQVLAAPRDQDQGMVWSGQLTGSGVDKLRLIYSSAPVSFRGQLSCADGSAVVQVNVSLPGGWSAVREVQTLSEGGAGRRVLINPAPAELSQNWHRS